MQDSEMLTTMLSRLRYQGSPNLVTEETASKTISPQLAALWKEAHSKFGADAAYFLANSPVIYFKRFEKPDPEDFARFHCKVWNQSRVPLIFIVLPTEIRVYNGYEAPRPDNLEPERLDKTNPRRPQHTSIWDDLEPFAREALDSGSFWRDNAKLFKRTHRADQMLLANLRQVRHALIDDGLRPEYAHRLIGRSIFALYLQDRGVLPYGPEGFFATKFGSQYTRYTDLLTSHSTTYDFFRLLRGHFNGDMFPVDEDEEREVLPNHLTTLKELFTVDARTGAKQLLFFWAYNFEYIPIELISSIYEEFLHLEQDEDETDDRLQNDDGIYYTPSPLASFILDQVMPWTVSDYDLKILDPACGSGIFLVEAYRRLIERWRRSHDNTDPSPSDLGSILAHSIFGMDKKRPALQVAAFSLYLAMLDYVEPKSIWVNVQFPTLIGTNLIHSDAFLAYKHFKHGSFDLIVGNPPWVSKLTQAAQTFIAENKHNVGDKQILQAFLFLVPRYCKAGGQIALLCSSKSLLFNRSGTNLAFRSEFFGRFHVSMIFDFSTLRKHLFEKAVAPTAAIFYSPQPSDSSATIIYAGPKPTPMARSLAAIVLEGSDLRYLPLWQVLASINSQLATVRTLPDEAVVQASLKLLEEDESERDDVEAFEAKGINIWKVALWGTTSDYLLVNALKSYPSLGQVAGDLKWAHGVGFNRGGPGAKKHFDWLDNAVSIEARHITRYGINIELLKRLPRNVRYYRGGSAEKFTAPLVLFKRSQRNRRPCAAFLDTDCAYPEGVVGFAGSRQDAQLLTALTALLNSNLAQYFLFMTSASWGVEREEIKAGELLTLPFPFLAVPGAQLAAIADRVHQLGILHGVQQSELRLGTLWDTPTVLDGDIDALEGELNALLYSIFELSQQDIRLVEETVRYTIGMFNSPSKSAAIQQPLTDNIVEYAQTFTEAINFYLEPIDKKFVATTFDHSDSSQSAWSVVKFDLARYDDSVPDLSLSQATDAMRAAFSKLGTLSVEEYSPTFYHRRSFRLFLPEGNSFFMIKPAEQRFWTTGAALSDADEMVASVASVEGEYGDVAASV